MKLSICIVVKDRSKVPTKDGYLYLLPKCIESISNYHSPEQIEVVICDFHSKDWPLEEWVDDYRGEVDVKISYVIRQTNLDKQQLTVTLSRVR